MELSRHTLAAKKLILSRLSRSARVVLVAALGLATAACGGGGGGGSSGGGTTNSPPRASFTATPTAGAAPLQVAFDGSGSSDSNGSIASYAWTFGDGGTATGVTAQHTYQAAGSYTATLVVTDNQGASSTPFSRTIEARAPGGLAVTVRDDLNALVVGATVTVTIGTFTQTMLTDASGVATLNDLPLGSATVNVSKTGYSSVTQTANPVSGAVTPLNARITRLVGSINVTVVDAFDRPVANATVTAAGDGRTVALPTNSSGLAALTGVPTGTTAITASATGYRTSPVQQTTIVEGVNPPITIVLERATSAAAGSVGGAVDGTPSPDGTEVTLRLRFVVVDQDGEAITTLNAGAFQLQPCTNSTPGIDCIRRPTTSTDGSYTVVGQDASQFQLFNALPSAPYSAAMLFDQSSSVNNTDPTDARVFAGKGFLQSVGAGDAVTLAAFAADGPAGGEALIPEQPLTVFGSFTSDGTSYFDEIDTFPSVEGGDTPFYDGLDGLLEDAVWSTAPVGPRRAVVVFTDGVDTDPDCPSERVCRQATIARANSLDIDIFTIGLSTLINVEALAELANGTGGAFLFTTDAQALIPIYGSLGALLSGSLPVYETVWTIRSGTTGTFQSGHLVLGKMNITTPSGVITVPFIVPI